MERRVGVSTSTAGPCIRLLQEKLRQLKRQREQREERNSCNKRVLSEEKFKAQISESTRVSLATDELTIVPTTSFEDPLSLGLNNLSPKHMDYRDIRKQISWQHDTYVSRPGSYPLRECFGRVNTNSRYFENHDVDTSLHL